jgi:hypothetical protein
MTIKKWKITDEKVKNFNDKDADGKDFDGMGRKPFKSWISAKSTKWKAIRFDQAIIDDIDGNNLNYADNQTKEPKMTLELSNRLIVQKDVGFYRKCKIKQLEGCFRSLTDDETKRVWSIKMISKKTSK